MLCRAGSSWRYTRRETLKGEHLADMMSNFRNWEVSGQMEEYKVRQEGSSLVVRWLRIHLPMQGIRVQSLVWEDSTAMEELNPFAATTEPTQLEPMLCN